MAYKILTDVCEGCGSCEAACPNEAISHKKKTYKIDPNKCKECQGDYDKPQCADVCPNGACVPA